MAREPPVKTRLIFILSAVGILLGLYSARVHTRRPLAQPPAFAPTANPYQSGIFANGIIESAQTHGSNINLYPEVAGPVTRVVVSEGDTVRCGDALLTVDDSVPRATVEQLRSQAAASLALLEELKAQPRPENLRIAEAQVANAEATLKNERDHLEKFEAAHTRFSGSVSRDELDSARNAAAIAYTALAVAQGQLKLLKAGAWTYDVRHQEMQYHAAVKATVAADAQLAKYTLRAPRDGVVLSIGATEGSYVSPQGTYDTYSRSMTPLIVMGTPQDVMEVRCFVDEVLLPRLPAPDKIVANMKVRGSDVSVPLTYRRMQPYVSPRIELADQRSERVDVRVLPLVFRFDRPKQVNVYPGQLVDVYIGASTDAAVGR